MSDRTISVSSTCSGQVCEIELNQPTANILTAAMMAEISTELDDAAGQANLKLLVFSGSGRHFCYGASVQEHSPENVGAMLPNFHRLIEKIIDHPVPTLAKVRGHCLGGGFELALACSFLYAEEAAQFAVPEIQLGVFPPVAAALLPPTVGAHMILSGASLSAAELQQAGLLSALAEADELDATVAHYIETQILPRSASSLRFAHRALRLAQLKRFRSVIAELETLYLEDLMATHDAREGIAAFLERRQPQWSNA